MTKPNELINSMSGFFGKKLAYCNSLIAEKNGLRRCNKPGRWWNSRYEGSLCDQCKAYVDDKVPGGWIELEAVNEYNKTVLIPLANPNEIKYDTINLYTLTGPTPPTEAEQKLAEEELLAEEPNDGQAS